MLPLPPGAECLQDEIESLEKIDLDSLEPEEFSETVLYENISLEQNNSLPNSVEHEKENSPELEVLTPMPSPFIRFSPVETDSCCEYGSHNSPLATDYTDSPLSTPGSRKRKFHHKKDKGNLRETYTNMWADEKRKYNVNHGLKYQSRNGKMRPEKKLKSPCSITCKKNVHYNLPNLSEKKYLTLSGR